MPLVPLLPSRKESTNDTPKIGQIWGYTPEPLVFSTPSGEYKPTTTLVAFFILELLGGVIAAFVFTITYGINELLGHRLGAIGSLISF